MSDAIGKLSVTVAANTGPAATEFDKLIGTLKAAERQITKLQNAGKSDLLVDATRDIVTQARAVPRAYADAGRAVPAARTAARPGRGAAVQL